MGNININTHSAFARISVRLIKKASPTPSNRETHIAIKEVYILCQKAVHVLLRVNTLIKADESSKLKSTSAWLSKRTLGKTLMITNTRTSP